MPDNSIIKILVVDDEKLIRLTMSARLKKAGYAPVCASTVEEAVAILKKDHSHFGAIISDIVMGDMDGFVFRDIVRGIDHSMPFFFLTALDPEEGSGFLKKIVSEPLSYYLPKSVATEVLLQRVQRTIASRRIEQFIERQMEESKQSMTLASHIQRSMLPVRAMMTDRGFYTTLWNPKETVSGDLYEAIPFGDGCYLYLLGDIQGHGTSAALAMTAVQTYLKQLANRNVQFAIGHIAIGVHDIANRLQKFFRSNLADVSYMTALICLHRPLQGDVQWINCGAPDLVVIENGKAIDANPEHRGGLPIGLMPDTVYDRSDVVQTPLSRTATCVAYTDGLLDISRDAEGTEQLSTETIANLRRELVGDSRTNGTVMVEPFKFMRACEEYGYTYCQDDVTIMLFGARVKHKGIYEATGMISPDEVDRIAQEIGAWCAKEKWDKGLTDIVQLVVEEKLMNIYDHGFDDRERLHEVISIRLRKDRDGAELTVWDCGTPEPSLSVAGGSTATGFELANQEMSGHGRGRMMVRELCNGIERNKYGQLNETVYHIPLSKEAGGGEIPSAAARADDDPRPARIQSMTEKTNGDAS